MPEGYGGLEREDFALKNAKMPQALFNERERELDWTPRKDCLKQPCNRLDEGRERGVCPPEFHVWKIHAGSVELSGAVARKINPAEPWALLAFPENEDVAERR
jgi:hypothetical protein